MVTREQLLRALRAQPFVPFRLHMSSGRSHEIKHPELVFVMRSHIMVMIPPRNRELALGEAEDYTLLSLLHTAELQPEPLGDPTPPPMTEPEPVAH